MKRKIRNSFFLFCVLGSLITLNSCGKKQSTDTGEGKVMSGSITIDGSSTVYPITEAVAEEFGKENPEVKVTVGVSGTGGGFKKFGRGETDITDASRSIKETEAQVCRENKVEYVELPIAFDGLAVVVNKKNTWLENVTVEDLKKMWEPEAQGKITQWNQIRKEWPKQEIKLFGPGVASGTFDYFTEAIVGKSGSSRGDYTASEDDNVLVQGIEGNEYGIGFFGLAYYEENADQLKLVAVDNGKGPVKPSAETVKNGTYAPLSRPLFIYPSKKAASRDEVKSFVHYYLKNATELVKEVGYIPLPQEEYEKSIKKFDEFVNAADSIVTK